MHTPPLMPPPPPPRWVRIAPAAHAVGITPALLRSQIEAGLAPVRLARLGKRGLLHVEFGDVQRFGEMLARGPR